MISTRIEMKVRDLNAMLNEETYGNDSVSAVVKLLPLEAVLIKWF